MTTTFTTIIPSHVGYHWELDGHGWKMCYAPVKGVYSPPRLHPMIRSIQIDMPEQFRTMAGTVIGKDGFHFKNITEMSGAAYIFYLQEQEKIEIWGRDASMPRAVALLAKHFEHHRHRQHRMQQSGSKKIEAMSEPVVIEAAIE